MNVHKISVSERRLKIKAIGMNKTNTYRADCERYIYILDSD